MILKTEKIVECVERSFFDDERSIYEKIEDVVWVYNSSSMVLLEKRKINKSVRYNTTPTMKTRGRPPPSPSSGRKEEEEYDDDEEEEDKKKNDIVGGRSFSSFPSSSSFAVIVPNKKIVSIVYPGYECMQNIPEIVEKFGGKGKFTKACAMNGWKTEGATKVTHASEDGGEDGGEDGLVSSGTKSLELKFREKDELALPIYGEKLDAKTLVLRIVKTRGKSSASRKNQNNNSSTNNNIQVEAFARCTKKIEFRGLADFQYCSTLTEREEEEKLRKKMKTRKRIFASDESMNKRKSTRVEDKMEYVVNEDEIRAPTGGAEDPFRLRLKSKAEFRNNRDGIIGNNRNAMGNLVVPGEFKLVPPVYCKEDVPVDYFEDGETRKYREDLTSMPQGNTEILVDFADATVPQVLPKNIEMDKQRPAWYKSLVKLFKERPVWPTRGLQEKLRSIVPAHIVIDAKQTRVELREMAYKFNNGPFRKLWILRGFDPRLSKTYAKYQLYEIKLPHSWYNKKDSTLFPKVQKSIQQSKTHLDYHEFRTLPKTRFPIFFMDDLILPSVKREFRMIAEKEHGKDDDRDGATGVYAHGQTEYGPDGSAIISGCSEKFGFLSKQVRTRISERITIAYSNILNGKDPVVEDNLWVEAEDKILVAKQKKLKEKEKMAEEEALAIAAALATGRQRNRKKQKKTDVEVTIKNSTAPVQTNIPAYLGSGSKVVALPAKEDGFAALNAILEMRTREAPTKNTPKKLAPTPEPEQQKIEEGNEEKAEEPPLVAEEDEAFEIFDSD